MVTLSMWSALLNVTFTGHALVAFGDPDGQFAPIQDQHRMGQWGIRGTVILRAASVVAFA